MVLSNYIEIGLLTPQTVDSGSLDRQYIRGLRYNHNSANMPCLSEKHMLRAESEDLIDDTCTVMALGDRNRQDSDNGMLEEDMVDSDDPDQTGSSLVLFYCI